MASVAKKGLSNYVNQLQQHPLRTKVITAGVLSGISDIVSQKLTGIKKLQFKRLLLTVIIAAAYGGPFGHFFHKILDKIFKGKKDSKTVAKKVLIEQLISSPWNNLFFLIYYGLVIEGRPWVHVKAKVKKDYPSVQYTSWMFWPVVGFINHKFMPLHFRVLFSSLVGFSWGLFLNLRARSSCSSIRTVNAAIHVPKLPRVSFRVPKLQKTKLVEEFNGSKDTIQFQNNVLTEQTFDNLLHKTNNNNNSNVTVQLYAILEAVADRVEMHNNIREQRDNWNTLLLNSINMITLTATTMAGVAASTGAGAPLLALKLSSALLFSAATGLLLVMNKIQPSQLTEEQRNATRLFKQLKSNIETTIAIGNPGEEDVKGAMQKVLALDKAYPLPLLGAMLEKFPAKFEPAVWWPSTQFQRGNKSQVVKAQSKKMGEMNGWSEELEMEMREVVEVVKRKDSEDYDRLGNIALKINKTLAIAGPLLTGIAAAGSAFVGNGSWAALVPLLAGSLAGAVNTFEHGGQVGMVFEMYRASAGFFNMLETSIESTLQEKDLERRENGELFEMKMALQLGRSVSQLRELASKSAAYRVEGVEIDEFASKLF